MAHWLLLQETWVCFPGPTHIVAPSVCNCSSRASAALFWTLWKPGTRAIHVHTHRQNSHTHKIKLNLKKQKEIRQQMLVRMWGKRKPHLLLVGMQTETATVGTRSKCPKKFKNGITIIPTSTIPRPFPQRTPRATSEMSTSIHLLVLYSP